ncbi:MAG: NAD(P)-dependent alcohol dehydrogenase [Nannocystaceae bacterium]
MHAITYRAYGTPDVLELQEVETPTPAAHEVRVKVYAAAVTTADTTFRRGDPWFSRLATGLRRPKRPILGTEFAGVIDAVGVAVTKFAVGDRVFAASGVELGAHAEHVCVAEDGAIALMPAGLGFDEAAALAEGCLTALPFLRDHGRVGPGQSVLIYGASGAVGSAAVQLAKHLGATVTAVCSGRNVALARRLGADRVIDYTQTDFTQEGRRYDVIFDAVGKSSFARCAPVLKDSGVYLTTVPTLATLWQMLWTRRRAKRAILAFTGLRSGPEKARDLGLVAALAQAGALQPVIDDRFSLSQIGDAHRRVESGRKRGSAILCVAA